eukprot:TRINITY_DN1882_c0_g1_i13.p1 TRINITY_DN1882_c0_g1~~TRINITY_DN1882_c0_g1_i13.p1  ORF type:complete len:567 (+),score=123.00 TRINITY_DN1882_c0_g1_i13:88-1788(+)
MQTTTSHTNLHLLSRHHLHHLLHPKAHRPKGPSSPASPQADAQTGDIRERVTEFFKKHNPAKLTDVDKIVGAYAGREDQLMKDLHANYNVPDSNAVPAATPAPATPVEGNGIRERVTEFFKKHNPAKLTDVDKILGAYAGREDQLMKDLHANYNIPYEPTSAEPASPASPASPEGPSSPASPQADAQTGDIRERVTEFFKKHNPAKLTDVDKIVGAYAGREDQLMKDLHANYNVPLPGSESVSAATPAPATPVEGNGITEGNGIRDRVIQFFKKHNPAKLADVDKILGAYAGREDQLMKDLHANYNIPDEPTSAEPASPASPASPEGPSSPASPQGGAQKPDASAPEPGRPVPSELESPVAPESPSPSTLPQGDLHMEVTEFFKKHNPAKLADVDKILSAYAGREDQLMKDLHANYNVPLPGSEAVPAATPASTTEVKDIRERVTEFFKKHNPAKLTDIDKIVGAYRERVTEFFKQHNPAKLSDVDKIVGAYAGREDQLMKDLHANYNVPFPGSGAVPATTPAPASPAEGNDIRNRVAEFFKKHNPAKLALMLTRFSELMQGAKIN